MPFYFTLQWFWVEFCGKLRLGSEGTRLVVYKVGKGGNDLSLVNYDFMLVSTDCTLYSIHVNKLMSHTNKFVTMNDI